MKRTDCGRVFGCPDGYSTSPCQCKYNVCRGIMFVNGVCAKCLRGAPSQNDGVSRKVIFELWSLLVPFIPISFFICYHVLLVVFLVRHYLHADPIPLGPSTVLMQVSDLVAQLAERDYPQRWENFLDQMMQVQNTPTTAYK